MSRTYCSEVLSLARRPQAQSESGDHLSDVGTHGPPLQVKVLLITERVDGFFLERFTDRGELVGDSQYETLGGVIFLLPVFLQEVSGYLRVKLSPGRQPG